MTEEELILTTVKNCQRIDLYADPAPLSIQQRDQIDTIKLRRQKGEPLQYLLGSCEFMGLKFKVDSRVLIPRPETELLVEAAIRIIKEGKDKRLQSLRANEVSEAISNKDCFAPFPRPRMGSRDENPRGAALAMTQRILDLGTGSGNIAISLAKFIDECQVTTVDISQDALDLACENARLNGVEEKIQFVKSDLFDSVGKYKTFLTAKNSFPTQQRRYDAPTYLKEPLEEVGTVPASSFNYGKESWGDRREEFSWELMPLSRNAYGKSQQLVSGTSAPNLYQEIVEGALENSLSNLAGFDMMISNPPYIPSGMMTTLPADVQKEPTLSLDGGKDGLDFYRRIVGESPVFLKPGGLLLLEIGDGQREAIEQIVFPTQNFIIRECVKDYRGMDRIMILEVQDG